MADVPPKAPDDPVPPAQVRPSSASEQPVAPPPPTLAAPLAGPTQPASVKKSAVAPTPGEVITSTATGNSYTFGDQVGEGGFGVVYRCTDVWNNLLAAKVLKPRGTYEGVRQAAEGELQRLLLLRHPYITYAFDAFEYRDTFYIITEYCDMALDELMQLPKFDGSVWVTPIARCLLQAVQFAHLNGYAHQDIHCGNVFAALVHDEMSPTEAGAIKFKLGDLGVAKFIGDIGEHNTRAQWMLPPEVLDPKEFGPIDLRVDIYHAGLLFLQILAGKELRFTKEQVLEGVPRQQALALPRPFSTALEKALRRHVPKRTETAMEMWRDLNSPAS